MPFRGILLALNCFRIQMALFDVNANSSDCVVAITVTAENPNYAIQKILSAFVLLVLSYLAAIEVDSSLAYYLE